MKTQWVDANPSQGILGTLVTADWLRLLGNHRHTGIDEDGNCPLDFYTAGGTANALTITCNPPLTAHIPGMPIYIKIPLTNTGPVTLKVDGLDPLALKKGGGLDLAPGDLPGGTIIVAAHDGADFELLSGFTKFAGFEQARAMSDPALSLSPAALGQVLGAISGQLSAYGYLVIPGKILVNGQYRQLIVQWASTAMIAGVPYQDVMYPIAFPNGVFNLICANGDLVNNGAIGPSSSWLSSNTGFRWYCSNTSLASRCNWLAIGF